MLNIYNITPLLQEKNDHNLSDSDSHTNENDRNPPRDYSLSIVNFRFQGLHKCAQKATDAFPGIIFN